MCVSQNKLTVLATLEVRKQGDADRRPSAVSGYMFQVGKSAKATLSTCRAEPAALEASPHKHTSMEVQDHCDVILSEPAFVLHCSAKMWRTALRAF